MRPHKQQRLCRQLPDHGLHLFPAKDRDGIGLFVVAAQLGKHLVIGNSNGHRQAQLFLHRPANLVGNLLPGPKQPFAAVDIQPAFVQAEGLHLVGKPGVDLLGLLGIQGISLSMGLHQLKLRTLPLGLPNGFRRLDTLLLCQHILRQNDPVTALLIPCHGHGHIPVFRREQRFHRSVEIVHVHVQNSVFH